MINPFNFFRNKTAAARRRSAAPSGSSLFHAIRAHFIAADPAPKSSEWWRADNLTADADANPEVRRTLRMRSRFEIQNNPYARGMVQTVANDSIGSGPRLRFGSDDDDLNTRVERDFTAWSEMIRLATKLRTIRITRAADGEAFVMLANNPALHGPVKLDHQTYFRSIWTERAFVEDQILNRLFIRWFREWCLAHPEVEISDAMTPWHGHWIWPHTDDLDLVGAAKVQELSLKNNTTTLAHEYARQGKNWKTELEQIKKEREYMKELGL